MVPWYRGPKTLIRNSGSSLERSKSTIAQFPTRDCRSSGVVLDVGGREERGRLVVEHGGGRRLRGQQRRRRGARRRLVGLVEETRTRISFSHVQESPFKLLLSLKIGGL